MAAVALMSVILLLLLLPGAGAETLVESDDFTGPDGSPPDPARWAVLTRDADDNVTIEDNTVLTSMRSGGKAYFNGTRTYLTSNFTVLIDWLMTDSLGRTAEVRIYQHYPDSKIHRWIGLYYDEDANPPNYGWGWIYQLRFDGEFRFYNTSVKTATFDTWYTLNLTVHGRSLDITVTERDTGDSVYYRPGLTVDPIEYPVSCLFGSFSHIDNYSTDAYWDNFRFIDYEDQRPVWGQLPVLSAVEDVPFTYDFSANFSDVDSTIDNMSITSPSPYFVGANGLEATFEFPNGVISTDVALVLSDGIKEATTVVHFTVQPVNDPPGHSIPADHTALEDVPYILDVSALVWDEDNPPGDLSLTGGDGYVTVEGLTVTATFPQGVLAHDVSLQLTDGLLSVPVDLHFNIDSVDDPPTVDPLGTIKVIEGQQADLDLTPYLHDVDTPIDELVVLVESDKCTVEGKHLLLLYEVGYVMETVVVQVRDGNTTVSADLIVQVENRNDAPIVAKVPPVIFQGHAEETLDLSLYISDEDDPIEDLVLRCDDPSVLRINGLSITFVFTDYVPYHEISFEVSDGLDTVGGSFEAEVEWEVYPPVLSLPGTFIAVEDQVSVLDLEGHISDIDTPVGDLAITVDSANCTVFGTTLQFLYRRGGSSDTVTVQVTDGDFTRTADMVVEVEERNDAPVVLDIGLVRIREGERRTIDLSPYISDEETPSENLVIVFDDTDQVMFEGLSVSLLFHSAMPTRGYEFRVSDGQMSTPGTIRIEVQEADGEEPPFIVEHAAPIAASMVLVSLGAAVSIEVTKVWLIALFFPLYMKLSKSQILDHFTRGKIYGYIVANPGEHFNAIKKALGISNGSFVYHANLLESEGLVKTAQDGIYKRYFPAEMRVPKRMDSLNSSQTIILETIQETPGISQKEIAAILGVRPSTVNYHVEALIDRGLVRKERKGVSLGYYIDS